MFSRKNKISVAAITAAVVLAITTMSFTKHPHGINTNIRQLASDYYWVYTSPTPDHFNDTAKYTRVFLDPNTAGCNSGFIRPCIYSEATGTLATKADLYMEIHALDDNTILNDSYDTKN